ncbi:response regulator transcription factor [Petroclostridium xylanilyticum]|uniref:response regulator transcription factor n=1 Tax=Petroclostridium xylanilyticum TaxID=1792311 RepID=UPI000B97FD25|nr:response regulator [Petroclostridium xylanilyticum]
MYKIMIVDDEYEIRNGLCNYFPWNEIGFEVAIQAENGKQALEYLQKYHIDIILCDIMMPTMTGIELAKKIYDEKWQVKIIFLSGYRDFEYAQQALSYGVKSYIVKPTKYDELFKTFSNLKTELDLEHSEKFNNENSKTDCVRNGETDISLNFHDKIISTIKSHVKKHYKDVTLENIAELVHMNPYYLSKFFKQKTGQNFSDYVITVKMKKAAELLDDINYKTYEISDMVGYSSPKNFTRTFKKYFGMSPREYRNSNN